MEVKIISLTEEGQERQDYRNMLKIEIDGERVFSVYDGEPEDANLNRDFNDCWNIPTLMRLAHKAGIAGESITFADIEVDEP